MILITRPKEQSIELSLKLNRNGFQTFQENLYSIKYLKYKINCDSEIFYIFPSIHSVKSLIINNHINKFKEAKIFAIGSKVKKILKDTGLIKVNKTFVDSNELLNLLKINKYKNCRLVYLSGNFTNKVFFKKANEQGINIKKRIVYKTKPRTKLTNNLIKKIKFGQISVILFYSVLASKTFIKLISDQKIIFDSDKIKFICISKRVAKPLFDQKYKFVYAANLPNQEAIIDTIKSKYDYDKIC